MRAHAPAAALTRRALSAVILKVIEPLFMDDLRAEFERVRKRRGRGRLAALRQFQAKLGGLTFFDPACGCGNFLIMAYRELRLLEIEVIRDIRDATATTGQGVLDAARQSVVGADQFYAIELGEFPARIAEAALWMMDHIMNNRLNEGRAAMMEGAVCPNEVESHRNRVPKAIRWSKVRSSGRECRSWFQNGACSATVGTTFGGHLGNVGSYRRARAPGGAGD